MLGLFFLKLIQLFRMRAGKMCSPEYWEKASRFVKTNRMTY